MYDGDVIIPPVRAGAIDSSIDFQYDHSNNGEGGFEATAIHEWDFDLTAYADLTGLDLGRDYPAVAFEGGRTVRVGRTVKVMHCTYDDSNYWTIGVYDSTYHGTEVATYRIENNEITRARDGHDVGNNDYEPLFEWPTSEDIDFEVHDSETVRDAIERFVTALHMGTHSGMASLNKQIEAAMNAHDQTNDAIPLDEYQHDETTDVPASAD